jgi:hypothetical protein
MAMRAFESANDRAATPAERKLLRDLAARLEPVAVSAIADHPDNELPASGWGWIEAAVWEAVEAGSAFVAPRRVREIALRWEREGFPGEGRRSEVGGRRNEAARRQGESRSREMPDTRHPTPDTSPPTSDLRPPTFVIEEIGLSNRQVWAAALDELARQGTVGRADLETWLRPAALIGRDNATLIVGAPNAVARDRISKRLLPAVRDALAATIGATLAVVVVVDGEAGMQPDAGERISG